MKSEHSALWHLATLDNLELLAGTYIQQVFPWHFHDTYCIAVQERGFETLEFRDQKVLVPPGTLLVIPPGEAHTNYAGPGVGWQFRSFYPSEDHLRHALCQAGLVGSGSGLHFPRLIQDPALARELGRVHRRLQFESFNADLEKQLFAVLAHLVRGYGQSRPAPVAAPVRFAEIIELLERPAGESKRLRSRPWPGRPD